MFGQSILSLVIWVPDSGRAWRCSPPAPTATRRWRAGSRWPVRLLGFIVAIPLATGFDTGTSAMQFVEKAAWIPAFNIHYHLGVDGISMPLILLNSFITVLVVIAGWQVIQDKVAQYMAAFLIMSGLINGVFAALDGILFYVFFEGMLIPLYLIVGVWGGPNRVYAAFKFFLYTLLGSLLMLVSMIYLYFQSGGSFDIQTWHTTTLGMTAQTLMFFAFLLAFGGQGADVAGAYLVARCPRRGAHRRLGGAGGDHAEGRRLRLPALHPADRARCQPRARLVRHHAVADRRGLHRPGRAGAGRHEEAHRLFVDRAHGLRHARLLHVQPARPRRRPGADDLARLRLRRAVPLHRRDVRPPAFAPDQGLRRPGQQDAGVRRLLHAVRHGQRRPARHQRLRRRVHGHHGRDPGQFLVRLRRRHHADLRRGLHAVDVQARGVRHGHQPARRGDARHQRARDPGARRARRSACWPWACIPSRSPT